MREKQEYTLLKEKSSKHTNTNKWINWTDKKKAKQLHHRNTNNKLS
jgi:hypothetical protein